jgi:hypothetical protein
MPRSGNTLLGSLINQNTNIKVTANSILCDVLYELNKIKNFHIFKNFPDHKSFDNITKNVFKNYYKDWKTKYIIDRGPWGINDNLFILKNIIKKPKFIILYRPVLECLASFIKIEKPNNIEERCDWFMSNKGIIGRNLNSIENIIKNEKHIVINYKDLIKNPIKQIKKIFVFLKIPFKKIKINNFNQFSINNIFYDDSVCKGPLHTIRTDTIKYLNYPVKEILSNNIINKYSNLDIL